MWVQYLSLKRILLALGKSLDIYPISTSAILTSPPHTDQGVSNSNFGANISYDSGILAVGVANESAPNLPFAGAIHLYRVNSDNQVSFIGKVQEMQINKPWEVRVSCLKNNILVTRNTNQLRSFAISGTDLQA